MDSVASVVVFGVLVVAGPERGRGQPRRPRRPFELRLPGAARVVLPLALPDAEATSRASREMIGTIVIPTAIMVVMLLIPLFDKVLPRGLAHFLACWLRLRPGRRRGLPHLRGRGRPTRTTRTSRQRAHKADEARQRALRAGGDPASAFPPTGRCTSCCATRSTHGRAVLESKCLGCHCLRRQGDGQADRPPT